MYPMIPMTPAMPTPTTDAIIVVFEELSLLFAKVSGSSSPSARTVKSAMTGLWCLWPGVTNSWVRSAPFDHESQMYVTKSPAPLSIF